VTTLHTFILSWPGFEEKARVLELAVTGATDHLTVIHSLTGPSTASVPDHWVVLPDGAYYGVKFKKSLGLCVGDVMVHIQADVQCEEWPRVLSQCKQAFVANPDLALWAPLVWWTPWSLQRTTLESSKKKPVHRVTMVDGIVWALGVVTRQRLEELDYSNNPLGRGIELAAAAFARAEGFLALVDSTISVLHPKGSGYSEAEAARQLNLFLDQLSEPEQEARRFIERIQWERLRREKNAMVPRLRKSLGSAFDRVWKRLGQS
jgi:hypothetical protein